MANNCSGFWPPPLPPAALGKDILSLNGASPLVDTVPFRPGPSAVAFAKYWENLLVSPI